MKKSIGPEGANHNYAVTKVLRNIITVAGSLQLATLLLGLLVIAMACATVVESTHSTERALETFYRAPWFKALLWLIALNILVSMLLRSPHRRRHIPFIITHCGILITLAGALVTHKFAINGQITLEESQSTNTMSVYHDNVTITESATGHQYTIEGSPRALSGFFSIDEPRITMINEPGFTARIEGYIPDSRRQTELVDDNPYEAFALELSFGNTSSTETICVFNNQQLDVGGITVLLHYAPDEMHLDRLLKTGQSASSDPDGELLIAVDDAPFRIPLSLCVNNSTAIGDSGYNVKLLHCYTHAVVQQDRTLANNRNEAPNPAVEVEFSGPAGNERRIAFSRFPQFDSMHSSHKLKNIKLVFVASVDDLTPANIEILGCPGKGTWIRFNEPNVSRELHKLEIGKPLTTPWNGVSLTATQQFTNARLVERVLQVTPPRIDRVPAVRVSLTSPHGQDTSRTWTQLGQTTNATIDGQRYTIAFSNMKEVPLGFSLTLNGFRIRRYPGSSQPRSFESYITLEGIEDSQAANRTITMNHPVVYAGYTLFQSRYDMSNGRKVSVIGVAYDPGKPVVYVGYGAILLGFFLIIISRIRCQTERRSE